MTSTDIDIINTDIWQNSIKLTRYWEKIASERQAHDHILEIYLFREESGFKLFTRFSVLQNRIQGRINKLDKNSMKAFLGGCMYAEPRCSHNTRSHQSALTRFTSNVLYDRNVLGVIAEFLSLE